MMNTVPNKVITQSGFSLIEVAVVMVILALVLAAAITPLSTQIELRKIKQSESRVDEVIEALYGFAAANGRLPCPATPTSAGQQSPAGGGNCTLMSGFVPGATLGLRGEYDADGLLLDAWGNPVRYSVTQTAGTWDFTTNGQMQAVTMAGLAPDLVICDQASASNTACSAGNPLSVNAVAVIISLGKDGVQARAGGGMSGAGQLENSGELTLGAGPSGVQYRVGGANNQVFVSRTYSNNSHPDGEFNDIVNWISPNVLYSKMLDANALP